MSMSPSFLRAFPLCSLLFHFITAHGQNTHPSSGVSYGSLSGSLPSDLGLTSIDNDSQYRVDIVLGGQNFTVIVDTGSTDLWVDLRGLDIQIVNNTDLVVDTPYAAGDVKGNVAFAEFRIGPYVVPHQAFINATNVTDIPQGTQGLMGMAFDTAAIYAGMLESWSRTTANELARSPITSLIAQNASAPGFFDLELGRTLANGTALNSHMFIGQHLEGMELVSAAPKIERISPFHWTFALDGANINGKPFAGWKASGVDGTPAGKVAAVLDSGFTYSAFPKELVDAIYGSIPGAIQYNGSIPGTDNSAGLDNWIVPCGASANVSFVFAGQEYPVHPLDVVNITTTTISNATICTNRFFAGAADEAQDIILGMGFLRNVYGSFQYGNYTPPGGNITGQQPYVQLVSVTDPEAAWAEYYEYYEQTVAASGAPAMDPANWLKFLINTSDDDGCSGASATSGGSPSAPGSSGTSPSTSPDSTDVSQNLEAAGAVAEDESTGSSSGGRYAPIALGLLGANLAIGLAVLVVAISLCMRSRKGRGEDRYKHIRLPKEESHGDVDPERAVLYSD